MTFYPSQSLSSRRVVKLSLHFQFSKAFASYYRSVLLTGISAFGLLEKKKLICGRLHRKKDLFGEDSHIFDPERWLDSRVKKASTIGLVGNLYVLSSDVVDDIHGSLCTDDT